MRTERWAVGSSGDVMTRGERASKLGEEGGCRRWAGEENETERRREMWRGKETAGMAHIAALVVAVYSDFLYRKNYRSISGILIRLPLILY